MAWLNKADVGQRKQELSIFTLTLVFILALFGVLNDVVAKCIVALFTIAIGGNVGSKIAKILPALFNKEQK